MILPLLYAKLLTDGALTPEPVCALSFVERHVGFGIISVQLWCDAHR